MNKSLYLECASGISGDMFVAALLDLGADQQKLLQKLQSFSLVGADVKISRVKKSSIDMCDFCVQLDHEHENHDHDLEYLHGEMHPHTHHAHLHKHSHEHMYEHRSLSEVYAILEKGDLEEEELALAKKIFLILAEAEAKAHGIDLQEVHFHEVGAVDSILDIAAAAICFCDLAIDQVYIPCIFEGCGTVRCRHGILPVPVPAVLNIAADKGLQLSISGVQGEFVTPTGAAIAAAIKTADKLPDQYRILSVGMGAGKREYDRPSFLRAMLIEESAELQDQICKLECNIDDASGEALGYCMEQLFLAGARDVFYTPCFMKKNRPAWLLTVISSVEDIEKLERVIFQETTTIGIRRCMMHRDILSRHVETIHTPYGSCRVKVCEGYGLVRRYPEYEDVARLAKENDMNYLNMYNFIIRGENNNCN